MLALLNAYRVTIGVSCDGPEEWNDLLRIGHDGRGSYPKVRSALQLLAATPGTRWGVLTVVNPAAKGSAVLRRLADLGVQTVDFIWPDFNHDHPPPVAERDAGAVFLGTLRLPVKLISNPEQVSSFSAAREVVPIFCGKALTTRGKDDNFNGHPTEFQQTEGPIDLKEKEGCVNTMTPPRNNMTKTHAREHSAKKAAKKHSATAATKKHSATAATKKHSATAAAARPHHSDHHLGECDIDLKSRPRNKELRFLLKLLKPLLQRAYDIQCPPADRTRYSAGYHNITICQH